VDVERVPAVFGNQAVHERDSSVQVDQPPGKGRADEPKPAGDEDVSAGKDFDTGGHIGVYRQYREFL
jgi:hypothetical protein